ncbi:hypothetical protein H6F93_08870 [Leptolyngbya sp. FACHB-671]|nr:hypothetical protein [Leptolyngbya sp. FACHB-671]
MRQDNRGRSLPLLKSDRASVFFYPPILRSRVKILITSPELGAGNNGLQAFTSAKPRRYRS